MIDDLNRFSFQSSRFKIEETHGRKLIHKETEINSLLAPSSQVLFGLIGSYQQEIQRCGIPLPQVLSSTSHPEKFLFVCAYEGPNVLQLLEGKPTAELLGQKEILNQVLDILKLAQGGNLYFDPHIKNFVFNGSQVFYVDFTPPWGKGYFDLRLSVAQPFEREILEPFFDCMRPETLGYHFAADFMKMSRAYLSIIPELYERMKEKNLVTGTYDHFLKIADSIMQRELKREREKVFLI